MAMDEIEIEVIANLWNEFFPHEKFFLQDSRIIGIKSFVDFFMSSSSNEFIQQLNLLQLNISIPQYIYLNIQQLNHLLPFQDFEMSLIQRPIEVIGSLSIALSIFIIKKKQINPFFLYNKVIIKPRLYAMTKDLLFHEIKSSTVGQLISITGHVVRVSACRPLIESANFLCSKCMQSTIITFDDGIFQPPTVCSTTKCYNKYLELDRSTVRTTDYQRIKLSELDEVSAVTASRLKQSLLHNKILQENEKNIVTGISNEIARIPRTIEIEVRGSLINTCIPGDLLSCVGVVKTIQMEAPRPARGAGGRGGGGYRESGLHELYILANSLMCLKSSGDRRTSIGKNAINPTSSPSLAGDITEASGDDMEVQQLLDAQSTTQALTMLDEHAPRVLTLNTQNFLPKSPSPNEVMLNASTGTSAEDSMFTKDEISWIQEISASNHAFPLLVHSLCPAIFGHELVKAGLLLALFGGSPYIPQKDSNISNNNRSNFTGSVESNLEQYKKKNSFHVRSDIHVLVVGDPGLGKSQMLRAAANIAPRAVFVCGNTSTAAGLTVTVSRDPGIGGSKSGGDLCIEAGALILADQGVCCIDELDKITTEQHALLEAMEQQCISVAKSGVVTSLKSRTTVLAAANPVGGHYNKRKTVSENLKMNAALLSRFDLIFILVDRPDLGHDRRISDHIMKSARTSSSNSSIDEKIRDPRLDTNESDFQTLESKIRRGVDAIKSGNAFNAVGSQIGNKRAYNNDTISSLLNNGQQSLSSEHMRRYIEYARSQVHPVITPAAAKVLQHLYLTMRAQSAMGQSIPVTTRHLESLIRLSQARARIDLRSHVTESDAQDVVQMLQESLLDVFTTDTGAIDCSRRGGISLAKQVKALVKMMTRECVTRDSHMFSRKDIADLCGRLGLDKDVDSLIEVMRTECYLLLKGPRLYQLMTAQ